MKGTPPQCSHCYMIGGVAIFFLIVLACCSGLYGLRIIDTHEHIASIRKAEILLEANLKNKIDKTVLIPSPIETLTLNGHKSFTRYRENTDLLFTIAEKFPGQYLPFCTVSPLDSDALKYLNECIDRGGKGVKLYNGHSYYYDIFGIPLDSPRMEPIYSFAERSRLPVLYHVNISKYGEELENVLTQHPDLVVSVPHYMVSSIGLDKVRRLLDQYPNLYTDVSFGSIEYMAAGFRRISANPEKYADFMNDFHDRVLFGADMVLTESEQKDLDYMKESLTCYKNLLEKRRFTCDLVSGFYKKSLDENRLRYEQCEPKEGDYCASIKDEIEVTRQRYQEVLELNGLHLRPGVLERIYHENAERYLTGEPV